MERSNYRFECLPVEGDWAHFKLLSFEDDEVPRCRSFYHDILLESFDHAVKGLFTTDAEGAVAVLSEADYRKKAMASPAAERLQLKHRLRHGYRQAITAAQLAEWVADPEAFCRKYRLKASEAGGTGDACYAEIEPWPERECIKSAHMAVLKVKVLASGKLPAQYGNYGVAAEVKFQVHDAGLLAHLVPGTIWNSDLYPLDEEHYLSMGG